MASPLDKAPDAFRTISEVAESLDIPAHVLRFWESRFPQIRPVKRAGGRRYYRPSDVALLGGIRRLLHDEGMTIRGVQKVLREQGIKHVAALTGEDIAVEAGPDAYDLIAPPPPVPAEVVDLASRKKPVEIVVENPVSASSLFDLMDAPPARKAPESQDLWLATMLRRLPENAFADQQDRLIPLWVRLRALHAQMTGQV
jgi:resuscitation-promoting factor RpfA